MPSFLDSGVIIVLALLLFGPKKLPVLARQLGKLMADFRRASNEFRTQMEEELRISEQADRQKKLAAIEAAAPATPAIESDSIAPPTESTPDPQLTEINAFSTYNPIEPQTLDTPVSYTHLDVYKRQSSRSPPDPLLRSALGHSSPRKLLRVNRTLPQMTRIARWHHIDFAP